MKYMATARRVPPRGGYADRMLRREGLEPVSRTWIPKLINATRRWLKHDRHNYSRALSALLLLARHLASERTVEKGLVLKSRLVSTIM